MDDYLDSGNGYKVRLLLAQLPSERDTWARRAIFVATLAGIACAIPGSSMVKLRVVGQLDGAPPPESVLVGLHETYGLSPVETLWPEMVDAKHEVVTAPVEADGRFEAELQKVVHMSLMVWPPLGVLPKEAPLPFIALRIGDEVYVVGPSAGGVSYIRRPAREGAPTTAAWRIVDARFERLASDGLGGWALHVHARPSDGAPGAQERSPPFPLPRRPDGQPPPAIGFVAAFAAAGMGEEEKADFGTGGQLLLEYIKPVSSISDARWYLGGHVSRRRTPCATNIRRCSGDATFAIAGFKGRYFLPWGRVSPFLEAGLGVSAGSFERKLSEGTRNIFGRGTYHIPVVLGAGFGEERLLWLAVSVLVHPDTEMVASSIGLGYAIPTED